MSGSGEHGPDIVEALYATILERRAGDTESSWTARLFQRGTPKIAQKVGEEAIETVIEALRGDRDRLVSESADLLYHLLVLWADQGVRPADVWRELELRRRPPDGTREANKGNSG